MLRKICQQEKHDFYWFFYAPAFVQKIPTCAQAAISLHFPT